MRRPSTWVLVLLLLLGHCSSPPTRVFDLSTGAGAAAATPARGGPLVWVDKPTVAGYFDRTQMVTRSGGNRISMHEFEV